jgi:hypothetical protein
MTTATSTPAGRGPGHGATALSSVADDQLHHPPHRLGNMLRAARVFGTVAAEVLLLGKVDERAAEREPTPAAPAPAPRVPPSRPPQAD